jgi:hypothetical protein
MHGTFNGVRLRRITSIATESIGNRTLTTFRVLEFPLPDLEAQLRLNATALVILSDKTIEGPVARYDSDRRRRGFRVTKLCWSMTTSYLPGKNGFRPHPVVTSHILGVYTR